MQPVLVSGAGLVLLALGYLVIRRLNAQQAERISTFHHSRPVPGRRSGPPSPVRSPGPATAGRGKAASRSGKQQGSAQRSRSPRGSSRLRRR